MASFARGITFATNGTVTAENLHNLIDQTTPRAGIITDRSVLTTMSTGDRVLIADTDDATNAYFITTGSLVGQALSGATYGGASFTAGTIATFNSTTGTVTNLTSSTATISTLAGNTTGGTFSGNIVATAGTVTTLTASTLTGALSGGTYSGNVIATAGTITTLNSTTGTITNLSTTLAGDLTISQGTATLGTSGVTAGTYGGASSIPTIVVDNKGRVTTASTSALTTGYTGFRNRIINGEFGIAQRATSFVSGANDDDSYNLDRWYVLSDGNDAVDITQETSTVPSNQLTAIALDVETANKKFGIAQIVEQKNCVGLIGGNVTLSFKAKVSSTTKLDNVKAAVVAWSGTADTVTSDIISAWENEGTNPTLIANATYENTPANLNVTTSYATYTVTANVDTASTKNLIVFIWSDVTDTTAGDFLYITDVQLEAGSTATDFERRPYGTELALCQRYYYRTDSFSGVSNGSAHLFCTVPFPVEMRASPTVDATGVLKVSDAVSSDYTQSSKDITINNGSRVSKSGCAIHIGNFSGQTSYRPYQSIPNESAFATFSAEL